MFVATCPHCHDSVTVPPGARLTSRVRCPLCTTEYSLGEMLEKMPPALELLDQGYDAGQGVYAASLGGETDVATLVADGAHDDIALAEAEPRAVRPSYQLDGGAATTEPRKLRTGPRPAKPQKNMVLEVVKIALGGAAAIPISQMILWWAAGTDPMELGPWITKNVPAIKFIVPAKLQTAEGEKKPAGENDNGATTKRPRVTKKNERPAGLPKLENNEIKSPFELTPGPSLDPSDPTTTLPDNQPVEPPLDFEPLSLPSDSPAEKQPEPPTVAELPSKPAPAPVANAPRYTAREVEEAAQQAALAIQKWTEGAPAASADQQRELMRALYTQLAAVGEKLGFADPADTGVENHTPAVRDLLFSIQPEPAVLAAVGQVGAAWLNPTTRKNNGIVLLGAVTDVAQPGRVYEATVALENKDKTIVRVVSLADPSSSFKTGDRVLVLGAIVSEPADIAGYEGDAPLVILNAMAVRVAAN